MTPLSQLMVRPCDPNLVVAQKGDRIWRWDDYYHSVKNLAGLLRKRPEKRWLLFEEDTYIFAIGFMALLHSGKTILLPPNVQAGTLDELVRQCDAMLGIAAKGVPSLQINGALANDTDTQELQVLSPEQCFIEVMTSGSTGASQIIRKTLSCFEQELDCQYQLWSEHIKDCTILSTVTHQHTYGLLFRLMLPLSAGLTFWASTHQYPEPLFADLLAYCDKVVLVSSPAHLSRLPDNCNTQALSEKLNIVFSSGGPLTFSAALSVQKKLGLAAVEIFGSTETGGVAWRRQKIEGESWAPLPRVKLNSSGAEGLLEIKSPYCFEFEWFQMSDVVRLQDDGSFVVLGRADRVIKIEEKRLSLTEMENRLQTSVLVDQAKLLVLSGCRSQLAAVLSLSSEGRKLLNKSGKRAVNDALKQLLFQYYERVLLPKKWRYPKELPFTGMGKLPQAALVELFNTPAER